MLFTNLNTYCNIPLVRGYLFLLILQANEIGKSFNVEPFCQKPLVVYFQ
jgi:hypothetical protein